MKKHGLKRPDNDTPNPIIPHVFLFPYSDEEFEEKNYSGDYKTLSKQYQEGQLVTEITTGPVLKPAKLRKIDANGKCDIEYSEYDPAKNTIRTISKTVTVKNIAANQLAGPNIFIDNHTNLPKTVINSQYDLEIKCMIDAEDVEPFCEALAFMANAQFRNKLRYAREHPIRPAKSNFEKAEYITGELFVTIVSARNLTSKFGAGNVYVEIKTYEHNYEEEQFGNFALDESFQKGKESQDRNTKILNVTGSQPLAKTILFDEEKNMGTFVKGATHEIHFIVRQESAGKDIELGTASIKSDEYLDPFRPAKEVYLLLDDPPYFISSLYLNVLFMPSNNTLRRMGIEKPVPEDFNKSYDEWILNKNIYVDKYGFVVPVGKYHPRLINTDLLNMDEIEEEYKENSRGRRQSKTPEKRLQKALEIVPSLREYNLELKQDEPYRPDYEEILFHFRQMQMYLNNEAKAQANEVRQEYCWNDFLLKVTDNIHDMSIEQGEDVDENKFDDDDVNTRTNGHMFSVANRAHWKNNSWQNSDIFALCRLGISYNLRSRVWYDLLEVYKLEELTSDCILGYEFYDKSLSIYENFKIYSTEQTNFAFAQIDEDMKIFNISNTPSRDDRGRIKNILKCFISWQRV